MCSIVVSFGEATPANTFSADKGNKYEVQIYVNGTPLTTSETLKDANGNPLKNPTTGYDVYAPANITAYIGVKGDATLNNVVDSSDASAVITYYSQIANGAVAPALYQSTDANLDQLAAFLADVTVDETSVDNWKTVKAAREISSIDASLIVSYYSFISNLGLTPAEAWVKASK